MGFLHLRLYLTKSKKMPQNLKVSRKERFVSLKDKKKCEWGYHECDTGLWQGLTMPQNLFHVLELQHL